MEKFFCADHSLHRGELPIGTANQIRTYVLIECPTPWAGQAMASAMMPAQLGQVMREVGQQYDAVRFLLVHRSTTQQQGCRSVIIYQQKVGAFCDGYDRFELHVDSLGSAAQAITDFFADRFGLKPDDSPRQDVLICTHGSRDQCCARYGNPFYAAAHKLSQTLSDVQIWRSSHFGGHRFAPTAITFPDGRYYARLTLEGLQAILARQVSPIVLRSMYRGWGILPAALQAVEQQLLERLGDRGYDLAMRYEILNQNPEKTQLITLLTWMERSEIMSCYAEVKADPAMAVTLRANCQSEAVSTLPQYRVEHLVIKPLLAAVQASGR